MDVLDTAYLVPYTGFEGSAQSNSMPGRGSHCGQNLSVPHEVFLLSDRFFLLCTKYNVNLKKSGK